MKVNIGFFVSKFLRWINRPALRNCIVDKTAKIGSGSNCINVKIGRYSYIGKNNSVVDAQIGAFCSIASYCAIGGTGHDPSMVSTSPVFISGRNVFRKNFAHTPPPIANKVHIGNDVWIGESVFIKAGVTIGDGAIIGAHSVVTKDVASFSIVAGAPARFIRFRFDEQDRITIAKSEWWLWPDNKLQRIGDIFASIKVFNNYENNSY